MIWGGMQALDLKVPPIIVLITFGILAWLYSMMLPHWSFDFPGRDLAAGFAMFFGTAVIVTGVVEFRRSRTTVNPRRLQDASALLTGGVYHA